jgi:Holliday junction resolvase RusA-like endonuclease
MTYEFEVVGDIKGKARPRMNTYTGNAYTPTNTKDYENLVKQYFKIKYPRYVPLEGRVSVKIIAYFDIPKATTKKDRALIEEGLLSPTKKPDIDNIVKIILDAMNKMAFKDDNQITKLEVEKVYTDKEERIKVIIEEY